MNIEYLFITYLNKSLFFEAIEFDKKQRERSNKEYPVNFEQDIKMINNLIDQRNPDFEITFSSNIADERLYKAFNLLPNKQQQILYLAYISGLKNVEIAKELNISKQAVTKARNTALNKLRKLLEVGNYE